MNWKPSGRKGIEDRRAEKSPPPSDRDSIWRGLPRTTGEQEIYDAYLKRKMAAEASGQPIAPPPPPTAPIPLSAPRPIPQPGDPAGIESLRAQILARMKVDQYALDELNKRAEAAKKLQTQKAPKR